MNTLYIILLVLFDMVVLMAMVMSYIALFTKDLWKNNGSMFNINWGCNGYPPVQLVILYTICMAIVAFLTYESNMVILFGQ